MLTVLLTTSGTGSRLGNLTKFTNKSLIQIGNKLAICYIIEQYETDTNFIITLGYKGNIVKDFLLLAYPNHSFTFINIDKYEGDGSSLGYSMLQARTFLDKPFIFHCCDTILKEKIVFDNTQNCMFLSKNNDFNSYTSVHVDNDKILRIKNKGELNNDYIYIGLVYIYNYSEFWFNLYNLYSENPNNSSLNDVASFILMIKQNLIFKYHIVNTHFDTGNVISYKQTRNSFNSSYHIIEKDNESLCFINNIVIKFISDSNINNKRFLRGKYLYPITPKILDFKDNFISMELINGCILSEYYTYGEIYKLLQWAYNNLWVNKKKLESFTNDCHNFYYIKTLDRINKFKSLQYEKNIINGLNIGSIFDVLSNINFTDLYTSEFSHFHGDFIIDNIIKTNDSYILLDWRHEFGSDLNYGDMYYDLAKLKHNIIFNHGNIIKNLYNINELNDTVTVDLKCNYFLIKQLDDFNKFVKEKNLNEYKINILTSLIWLNMASLYPDPLSSFLFYFGKFNLYLHSRP